MRRKLLARLGLVLAIAVLPSACGQGSCTFPPVTGSPVDGVVIQVDATGLTDVQGFSLRQSDGSTVAFRMGTLDDPTVFSPGHLKEHQATASPVRVWFKVQNGRDLVVYHLEDPEGTPTDTAPVSFSCG